MALRAEARLGVPANSCSGSIHLAAFNHVSAEPQSRTQTCLHRSCAAGSAAERAAASTRCLELRLPGRPDCAPLPGALAAKRLLGFGGSGKSCLSQQAKHCTRRARLCARPLRLRLLLQVDTQDVAPGTRIAPHVLHRRWRRRCGKRSDAAQASVNSSRISKNCMRGTDAERSAAAASAAREAAVAAACDAARADIARVDTP
eukprot:scaffold9783_cov127-Isochrysis_galbana.AAC.5